MARLSAMTVQAAAKPMIAAGLLTQEQHDSVQRLFLDPAFNFSDLQCLLLGGDGQLIKLDITETSFESPLGA